MNELAIKIQAVINTLEELKMPTTYENVNYMGGIYKALVEVRDALQRGPEVEEDAGKADPE